MSKVNRGKLVIGVCIVVFLLTGIILHFYGRNISEEYPATGDISVEINSNVSIAQKILGNDMYLKNISLYLVENNVYDDDIIDVYLMMGGYDLLEDNIIEHQTFVGSDIKNRTDINIEFAKTKLTSGRDYYIFMSYSDGSYGEGAIRFATSSDKVGLYGNGKHYGISLSYRVDYFSYINKLLFLWRIVFIFGSLTMVLCIIRDIRFAEAIGLVCTGIILLTYVLAAFGMLKWSFDVLMLLAGIAFFMLVWRMIMMPYDWLKTIWKQNVLPDALCWSMVLLIFFIIDAPKMIHVWDDLVHWARTVQNMYIFEALPLHNQSNVLAMAYPPACSLFQYMFLKIFGRSSEYIMYFSLHFLEVSFFMSCCDFRKSEKNTILAISTFICLCIGLPELYFPKHMTECIYIDILVGILLGYTFVRLQKFYEEHTSRNLLLYILSVATLVLTKENGLIFLLAFSLAQICLAFYLIVKKRDYHESFMVTIYTIGTMVIAQVSWQICLKLYTGKTLAGNSNQKAVVNTNVINEIQKNTVSTNVISGGDVVERSNLGIENVINFLAGKDKPYKYDIFGAHLTKLLLNGDYENSLVDMSFVAWFVVLCMALWILYNVGKKQDKIYLKWVLLLCGTGTFILCAFQVLYTFTFGETDARTFGGEDRYLGSYLIAMAILLVYFVYNGINEINDNKRIVVKSSICAGIFIITNFFAGFRGHIVDDFKTWDATTSERYDTIQGRTEKLRAYVQEKDKIYFCSKEDALFDYTFNYMYFSYNLTPVKFNNRSQVCPVTHEDQSGQYVVSPEQLREILQEYDYLYIYKNDDIFCEDYGELFDKIDPSEECTLFQINTDEDVMLQKIADLN